MSDGETVTIVISREEWEHFSQRVDDVHLVVMGDETLKIKGMRVELTHVSEVVDAAEKARDRQRLILLGVGIGLTANIVTGGATLLTLLRAFGGTFP